MDLAHLPFLSTVEDYRRRAEQLLEGWAAEDPGAVRIFRENHPRFLDETVVWLPKRLTHEELRSVPLEIADAQLAIARWHNFLDWERLVEWVEAVTEDGSPVARFESAVEAVVTGDAGTLGRLLREDPELVRERSTRLANFDPPRHRATLLHYIAANGVEGYRQKSPPNAVEIAKMLLDAGAEVDALASMYGGECNTMSMLVSSSHPKKTGVEIPLVELLLDYGSAPDGLGAGEWTSPLMTALVFGHRDAAETLVRRGARVESLAAAAGLGRVDDTVRLLPGASAEERHRALAMAAIEGRVETIRLLLDAGEDPNRYNPKGAHSHSTPLHQAICAGHFDATKLLVERGARLDIRDTLWQSTPLGWAEYCGKEQIAEYLRGIGAPS